MKILRILTACSTLSTILYVELELSMYAPFVPWGFSALRLSDIPRKFASFWHSKEVLYSASSGNWRNLSLLIGNIRITISLLWGFSMALSFWQIKQFCSHRCYLALEAWKKSFFPNRKGWNKKIFALCGFKTELSFWYI